MTRIDEIVDARKAQVAQEVAKVEKKAGLAGGPINGWAPGSYQKICSDCNEKFEGDKRAIRCHSCATAKPQKAASGLHTMLTERGKRYGKFTDHARVTQTMKDILYGELRRQDKLIAHDQLEALDMIVHKLGRIVCGDPDYENSWRNIAGYATLVADRLRGEDR